MNWLQSQAFNLLFPYLAAPLVFLAMQGIKRANTFVDTLPKWAKQGVVFVLSQVLTFAQAWSGTALDCASNCTLADVNEPFVKGIFVAGSAFLLHFLNKRQPTK